MRKKRRIIMKKKLLALISVATLATGLLAGCGSNASDSSTASSSQAESSAAAESSSAAASTESVPEDNVIKVAATAVPHAEILEVAKPILAEQGYDLEIQIFDDYVQPNEVVESGDFDANYFQHIPYLESFNEEKGTHLVNAGGIHYEPFGLYPGKETDLANIEGATIAVPNDTTNEARALLLLQDNGYITLKEGVGLTATVNDIVDNPYNIEIVELEAAQVPRTLPDVSFGVLNGNYAMEAGLTVADDALLYESADSEAAATYVNVIAVKEGNENLPKIQALVEVLKSDAIKEYINENYNGGVIPYL
jgi:D-methionine transport system substrate-binding protein